MFGRCDGSSETVAAILAGCSDGIVEPIPNAKGVTFKSLDGTNPTVHSITPSTMGGTAFSCVKVAAAVQPFAPQQDGGTYNGATVLTFEIVYQQVGSFS